VTQNWKHFTGDGGHGVTFREYGAINYAVSVIDAGRARALAKPHTRVPARSLLCFPCPRVRAEAYTGALLATLLRSLRFARPAAPTRVNDA